MFCPIRVPAETADSNALTIAPRLILEIRRLDDMMDRPWQRHYDYITPTTIRYPRIPVGDLLGLPANTHPDKAATNFFGSELTFWELRLQVLRLANALMAQGVNKGDRVGLHLPTCPQYVIAYHASLMVGAIVVNLNPMYTAEELKALTRDTGVTTLITFDMVLPHIRHLLEDVDIPRVIVTKITDYIQGLGVSTARDLEFEPHWLHFSQLTDQCHSTRLPRVHITPDDPALIQFTGGTTGIPKGAVLTHGNVMAATIQVSLWGQTTI
jgi:long-chain acyl-CoA synthetase